MTSQDFRSELEKQPFVPLRIHLVSGREVDVLWPNAAWMLQNAVLVFHIPGNTAAGYDVIALRNIERLEQIGAAGSEP
jgi:hypothetical protein